MSEGAKGTTSQPAPPFTCECGNTWEYDGFYPCDAEGHEHEDGELLCCQRCGRLTERATGNYAGHRSFAAPA